jgi:hypothetical protein
MKKYIWYSKERETIAVKPHYQTLLPRLQGIDPRRSGSAHNAQPGVSIDVEIKSRKTNLENKCATVEKTHLLYSAHNVLIDCIAVIHMERRVG